jgi:hypothetical protein
MGVEIRAAGMIACCAGQLTGAPDLPCRCVLIEHLIEL